MFDEWQEVSRAYDDDPRGSDVGYSKDELIRIEYREKLDRLSNTVSHFYNADFEPYSDEFVKMTEETSELIDYGNFIDAELKLKELNKYLSEHLALKNERIIYDISYDQEKNIWAIIFAALLFIAVYIRHISNIKRLFQGEENKIGKRKQ
ncbi:hypothetical protein LCGC14_1347020 [marine sediment metagenome]|uniref:Uncharacterized protein n=1 Tax=marine sediment metagenome TaxID=412755 RepID=A0A0F9NE94_9ZZZZ